MYVPTAAKCGTFFVFVIDSGAFTKPPVGYSIFAIPTDLCNIGNHFD